MPEMNSPGLHVEETNSSRFPIRGVSTSVRAFVGPTAKGPTGVSAELASFGEFEGIYGADPSLQFSSGVSVPNYLALAARAFFENGGQQLYVSRVATEMPPVAADYKKSLVTLDEVKDISIVAAPGSSIFGGDGGAVPSPAQAAAILAELIAHVSQMRYRFAVLDTPPNYSTSDVQALRSLIDSSYAALYYPWVTVANLTSDETAVPINVPPSGFVCGVYARSDAKQGVFKAPANLQLMGAVGLERTIQDAESSALNGLGINCLRNFPERGNLVWGARTVSSNSQYKYVNVRRYLAYLEHSIDLGTQWAVFEPNGSALWDSIRCAIQNFLLAEWRRGGLLGIKATDAFFVRCDESTMTQTDIDNGQVNCVIGVAVVRPAEFVIFRIGWKIGN